MVGVKVKIYTLDVSKAIGVDFSTQNIAIALVSSEQGIEKTFQKKLDGTKKLGTEGLLCQAFDEAVDVFENKLKNELNGVPVYIEKPFGWRNHHTTILLSQISGIILGVAHSYGFRSKLVANTTWKKVVGGKPTKEDTQRWVSFMYGLDDITEHQCDAIGIASYGLNVLNELLE